MNVLKEEKKLLLQHIKSMKQGGNSPENNLLLPPSIEADLTDMSDDELETRFLSLRRHRRRSPSRKLCQIFT